MPCKKKTKMDALNPSTNNAIRSLLFPDAIEPIPVTPTESCNSYLRKCKNNLVVEIAAFQESKLNPSHPNWRDAQMTKVYFERAGDYVSGIFVDPKHTVPLDLQEAAWNIALFEESLYLLVPKTNEIGTSLLKMIEGKRISDHHHTGSKHYMHLLGYVKPHYMDLTTIELLENNLSEKKLSDSRRLMLKQVADPRRIAPYAFSTGRPFKHIMPSNETQRRVVENLSNCMECIQGPPGTGKSTTIFHILQNRLPEDCKAIVTCVQNKAIDSIAEKLGTTDMPFLVLGNPERLGENAKEYTIDAQALRDPEVVLATGQLVRVLKIETTLRAEMNKIMDRYSHLSANWKALMEAYAKHHNEELRNEIDELFNQSQRARIQLVETKTAAKARISEAARAYLSTMDNLYAAPIISENLIAIIDEAGTVPEYKIPGLLSMGIQAIVAIGDQNQLPPFSNISYTIQNGFFQRIIQAVRTPMLKIQYRMHPSICDIVSERFYDGKLQTAPHVAALRKAARGAGIQWRDYCERDAESKGRDKKSNMVEVDMITTFMQSELPTLLYQGKTVTIITFYKHQLEKLMEAAYNTGYVRGEEVVFCFRIFL